MSTNPYQSPTPFGDTAQYSIPDAAPKPVTGVVFGILNLVYGILSLLCNGASSVMFFIPMNAEELKANAAMKLMADNSFYRIFNQGSLVLSLIASLVLIIAGIGLLQVRPFGRQLSIVYCLYDFIAIGLGLLVNGLLLFPLLIDQINESSGPEQFGAIGGLIGGIGGTVIGLIYPAVLLFFMYRPSVAAAYRA